MLVKHIFYLNNQMIRLDFASFTNQNRIWTDVGYVKELNNRIFDCYMSKLLVPFMLAVIVFWCRRLIMKGLPLTNKYALEKGYFLRHEDVVYL